MTEVIESSSSLNLPATGLQRRAITRLCRARGIREELEELVMSRLEARNRIYELRLANLGNKNETILRTRWNYNLLR